MTKWGRYVLVLFLVAPCAPGHWQFWSLRADAVDKGGRLRTCPGCEGSGKENCHKCKGRNIEKLGCPDCKIPGLKRKRGRGKTDCRECKKGEKDCRTCNGNGSKSVPHITGSRTVYKRYKCKPCKGSGKRSCRACNTEGWYPCNRCGRTGYLLQECSVCDVEGRSPCVACTGSGKVNTPPLPSTTVAKLRELVEKTEGCERAIDEWIGQYESYADRVEELQFTVASLGGDLVSEKSLAPFGDDVARELRGKLERSRRHVKRAKRELSDLKKSTARLRKMVRKANGVERAKLKEIRDDISRTFARGYVEDESILRRKEYSLSDDLLYRQKFVKSLEPIHAFQLKVNELELDVAEAATQVDDFSTEFVVQGKVVEAEALARAEEAERVEKKYREVQDVVLTIAAKNGLPPVEAVVTKTRRFNSSENMALAVSYLNSDEQPPSQDPSAAELDLENLERLTGFVTEVFEQQESVQLLELQVTTGGVDVTGIPTRIPMQSFVFQREIWERLTSPESVYRDSWRELLSRSRPTPPFSARESLMDFLFKIIFVPSVIAVVALLLLQILRRRSRT